MANFWGKSADHHITEIHWLAEECKFGGMKDKLIHDHLVIGIRDSAISESLQLESERTLGKVKKLICQQESNNNPSSWEKEQFGSCQQYQ